MIPLVDGVTNFQYRVIAYNTLGSAAPSAAANVVINWMTQLANFTAT